VLELRDLARRYGDVVALDGVSFSVDAGQMFGFVGPNGAGKTTAMRIVLGVLEPDRGEVRFRGEPVDAATRARFGYMPEERGLYPKMRVRDQLVYLARLHGADASAAAAAADRWIERLGLSERAGDRVEALSLGNQQRVQLAAALVHDPEVLGLDEPFSGLDPVNAEALKDGVLEMRRRGTTVVFSTHDMSTAEKMCDRIFMIFRGRKVLDGTLEEIQAQYGFDTVRLRTSGGAAALAGIAGIETVNDYGQLQEVRLTCDPQRFLQQLAGRTVVNHFEITRPSLHDIFVRIARPAEVA
jgi:ABC-2 type transport system ATP-binding protein